MKKRMMLGAVALATVGLIAAFTTSAYATPGKTTSCHSCHSGVTLIVTATETANNGATATYNVSAPGAYYIAVFSGTTKISQITGANGSVSVAVGHTYVLQAVEGPTNSDGWGTTSVSPVAPTPPPAPADTVAPVTTSDALATYVSSATIHLTATDNAGGSGVAATYYVLDGAPQASGTVVSVSAMGSHRLAFWSVDVAGNIESRTTATFAITAPVPNPDPTPTPDPTTTPDPTPVPTPTPEPTHTPDATGTASVRIQVMGATDHAIKGITVTLTDSTGATLTAVTDRHGRATFTHLATGTYTASATLANGHTLTVTFRTGRDRRVVSLKDHRHVAHHGDHGDHGSQMRD